MKLEDLIAPIINNPGVLPATLGVCTSSDN